MKIFLAGATGTIGRRLVPLLLLSGHRVVGTTRKPDGVTQLAAAGVEPVRIDAFDAAAVSSAVRDARPDAIINQLTDLPPVYDEATFW